MTTNSFSTPHSTPSDPCARALVLGGGGSAGNAWLIGVIAGLFQSGMDVTGADLIIGTSAGATATAQITGTSPGRLLADILAAPVLPRPVDVMPGAGRGRQGSASDSLRRTGEVIAASSSPAEMRRRMGESALSLGASSDGAAQARWRATVASRLSSQQWPQQRVLLTAVDANSGEPVVFDRDGGVSLTDAVAASCAGSFAYRIGDSQYIDGGYRRNSENADLAAGYGRVLVLSPLGGRTRHPLEWGMQLAVQVDELRMSGSMVETILPDRNSLAAFGASMMDLSTRPAAARAGYEQGKGVAGQLAEFWG
ncbi:hypothetical protein ART_0522 [Arthrobacter sp. PAMC 25486]|uniref:patatin-like phospholipase family protein n=1 Tax=Arthrobacter sp. PAMC 25486 TaxID=1494608 RepID=UPI000535BE8D|nr:patatin-like phospholipase family protein [Arthrobacter sp. PAMC 25486]AIY00121.1 hypothetical protein ART_0522 [Arthrobacter sp. PAMC 25486]